MSFSNPTVQNPCTKFYEYKGDTGVFKYYDKEEKKNIPLTTPCYFIVLDELSTIKGFSDRLNCGIYSNEVHSLNNETLTVRSFKGGMKIVGKYADIKDAIKGEGGKFTKSIYALRVDDSGESELINFQLSGAAFQAWMDFTFKQQLHVVCITGEKKEGKKGKVTYNIPVFARYNLKESLIPMAVKMDKVLQDYFQKRKEQAHEKEEAATVDPVNDDIPDNDTPEQVDEVYDNTKTDGDLPF